MIEPGVYFGLPDTDYHGHFALSASGIRNLRISTLDFWARSPLNPDAEREETEFMTLGTAYHKRIVEGREAFLAAYAPALDPADHPDALRTVEEMKRACAAAGLKVSGSKADLIDRLKDDFEIWDDLVAQYAMEHKGKKLLPATTIARVEISAAMIEKHPELGKAFRGGMPEVSIFWIDEETKVPMKARLDYLKPRAIVDLKTFGNAMGKPIDRAIAASVASGKYHIQCATYDEAVRKGIEHIKAGRTFGTVDADFLKSLCAIDERKFLFVFQQTGIAPVARGKVLSTESLTFRVGQTELDEARRKFAECWARYGKDPWIDDSPIAVFDDTEFPTYIVE
jgi:hypothetical protein